MLKISTKNLKLSQQLKKLTMKNKKFKFRIKKKIIKDLLLNSSMQILKKIMVKAKIKKIIHLQKWELSMMLLKKKTQQKKSQKKILLQKTILKLKTNKQKYQLQIKPYKQMRLLIKLIIKNLLLNHKYKNQTLLMHF